MITLRVAIMVIAMMLGLANVVKGCMVTVAQVNSFSYFLQAVTKTAATQ